MKRGKKLIGLGVVIILGLSLILVPLVSQLSPAQAAVTWAKSGANPVFIDSVVSGAACVIYDEGIYKMWYAHATTDVDKIDGLIDAILGLDLGDLINDIKNLDFSAIADNDADDLEAIIDYLEGLTVAELETLLVGTSSIISYATSTNGIAWTKDAANPVLEKGAAGEWDKYYVGAPCVIKNGPDDYEMWYTGGTMDLSAVEALLDDLSLLSAANISTILGDIVDLDIAAFISDVRAARGDAYLLDLIVDFIDIIDGAGVAIGHATSTNGIAWTKDAANPVLSKGSAGAWDRYGVGAPSVIKIGDTYKMWYTGCEFDYTTLLGLLDAENLDDIVTTLLGGINVAIGHATLTNSVWVKDDANPVLEEGAAGTWDGYGVGTPWVIRHSSTNYEMWYTGAKMVPNTLLNFLRGTSDLETAIISGTNIAIGHATSTNGIAWTPDANPVLSKGAGDAWDKYGVGAPCVIKMGDAYKMWYTGVKSNLSTFIRDILDGSNFATALDSSNTRIAIGYASYTVPAPEEPEPPPPPPPPPGITEVSDIVTGEGVFTEEVTAKSEDENVSVTIDEGTIGLTAEGEPLSEISIIEMEEPPAPPEDSNVIGLAYDFGPDEATFNPPITVKFIVDPATLPPGVAVEDLVIAYYNEEAGEWVELPTTFDPVTNTLMADVSHFTIFAIITVVPVVVPPVPAAFSVSSLSIQPAEVEPAEVVTIAVLVTNTGGESGSYTVVLKINGVKEAEERVTIAAGSSQTVTFSVTKEEAGSYTVAVDGLSGSFTVVPVVVPPAPAAFSVSYLFVSPRLEVEPGETVTIAVLVANTGGESGSYTAVLKIDGVKEAEERVTIAAGESQDVSFSVTKDVAGTYSVDVSGLTGSFTVKEEVVTPVTPAEVAEGIAWWVWLIVGLGVVVIGGLLAYFLWWKRRIA